MFRTLRVGEAKPNMQRGTGWPPLAGNPSRLTVRDRSRTCTRCGSYAVLDGNMAGVAYAAVSRWRMAGVTSAAA
jgi:hypothetical protein